MFSRMKTGDKATFFGYSKPDGTVIINQIRIVRSTNSVSQVGQSRN
jgi:altronate dehydratase